MKNGRHCRDLSFGRERVYWLAAAERAEVGCPDPTRESGEHRSLFGCVSELIYGAERSGSANRVANLQRVDQLRQQFVLLPLDDRAGEVAGRVRAYLANLGTPIGPNDLLIGSIALAQGLTLVTHNTAEFGRVPGLLIEDWQ